ncbi:HTH-type transcriptional repressor PurR [bioreactor metagenome]|uniref:HTH-type transcriptional repressor PurR n=1 Tax=bioreactor metagenome TaxID=1076179 RepID=A0A645HRQ7_9ZZZZ
MREFHYLSPTATGDTPVIACGHQLAEASPEIDAVIAAADYDALLLLYGLAERGCRVPETFSLVSIDDTLLGRFNIPSITSISLDRRELATAVFRRLSDRIEKRPTDETHLSIPTHLVHRKSVVPNYDTVPQPQEQ